RQPMSADGITPSGTASAWLADADEVAIYRRGAFVASNALPTVSITSPVDGHVFPAGASVSIQATANDADGTVAKVEFYEGSSKLGEATSQPYAFTWNNVPSGGYDLFARAIDNLGGATDSVSVHVTVGGGNRPVLSNAQVIGGKIQFTVQGSAGV